MGDQEPKYKIGSAEWQISKTGFGVLLGTLASFETQTTQENPNTTIPKPEPVVQAQPLPKTP